MYFFVCMHGFLSLRLVYLIFHFMHMIFNYTAYTKKTILIVIKFSKNLKFLNLGSILLSSYINTKFGTLLCEREKHLWTLWFVLNVSATEEFMFVSMSYKIKTLCYRRELYRAGINKMRCSVSVNDLIKTKRRNISIQLLKIITIDRFTS